MVLIYLTWGDVNVEREREDNDVDKKVQNPEERVEAFIKAKLRETKIAKLQERPDKASNQV